MDILKIKWVKICEQNFTFHYDGIYYALSDNGNIVFFGILKNKIVKSEINRKLKKFNLTYDDIDVWIGHVNYDQSTYMRISQKVIDDGLSLLINTHKPINNVTKKMQYKGRDNFVVKSSGCHSVRKRVRCIENKLYLS